MPDPSPVARKNVFLSYSHLDPNKDVVRDIYDRLSAEHEVFFDDGLKLGDEWAKQIETSLDAAQYFVVFVSVESAGSDWVVAETDRAARRSKETDWPRIMPVYLDYGEHSSLEISALLRRRQSSSWQSHEDTDDVIADIQNVLSGRTTPSAEITPALSRYLVSSARSARIRETFVPPASVDRAADLVGSHSVVWITGPTGTGKEFLASALACKTGKPVFELRRKTSWRQIFQNRPSASVLVLPDALASERAGTEDYDSALDSLLRLCNTENTVILTCTEQEFTERRTLLSDKGFDDVTLNRRYPLKPDSYSVPTRTKIVGKLIEQNRAAGIVSPAQQQWAKNAMATKEPWGEWTLTEIESFATGALAGARSAYEVLQLLSRKPSVEEQVHAWFVDVDDASRSLLLALLLFPEASPEYVWARLRELILELTECHLVVPMAIPALGICRAHCRPYVSQTDPLEIVESVQSAIAHQLAVSWREYVIELMPLLTRWALPQTVSETTSSKTGVDETASARQELARILGELMKIRIEDVLPFLTTFAASDDREVRLMAVDAIVHAFGSDDGARSCAKLLREWENDRSAEQAAVRKRMTAANACWRLAALGENGPHYGFAVEQLQRHTRDVDRVRGSVASGLSRLIGAVGFTEAAGVLITRLSADGDDIVRRRTGVALLALKPADADALFSKWRASGHENRLWTVAYALLIAHRVRRGDREKLLALMNEVPLAFARALESSLRVGTQIRDTDKNSKYATDKILWLTARRDLVASCANALGMYWAANPEKGASLCDRLGGLHSDAVSSLLVDAYVRRLADSQALELPWLVLADVNAAGVRRQIVAEAVRTLIGSLDVTDWHTAGDLVERFVSWVRTDLGEELAATLTGRLVEAGITRLASVKAFQLPSVVLAEVGAEGMRRVIVTEAMKTVVACADAGLHLDGGSDEWVQALDGFERFFTWLRAELGQDGRRAVVRLRGLIIEGLRGNADKIVPLAASWLRADASRVETRDAVSTIFAAQGRAVTFRKVLITNYWTANKDVRLILGACGASSAAAIRSVAFRELLSKNPSAFVAAAINETQEPDAAPKETLEALADLAEKESEAISRAIHRAAVDTAAPAPVSRLISDFMTADRPLRVIANQLWHARVWLFFRRVFSGG